MLHFHRWFWFMEMNNPLIRVTFASLSLQVLTPWFALGYVKKAKSSPWSYCRVLWGALKRVMSISPWARSSSCWGRSLVLRDKGKEIKMLLQSHVGKMILMKSLIVFLFSSLTKRSLYRDLLFLALVALGKNNINISKSNNLISCFQPS